MSDFQKLDLRSEASRRAGAGSFRGILITLAVVFALFALMAALGSGAGDGDEAVPAGEDAQIVPAAPQPAGD